MSAGYGRGYYGDDQLSRRIDPNRGGGGWFKFALVAGLGVVIWKMLPIVGPKLGFGQHKDTLPPPAPSPQTSSTPPYVELEQMARSRGFSTIKDYEDAVLEDAKELRAAGAKVDLGPHLQHLESRLSGLGGAPT